MNHHCRDQSFAAPCCGIQIATVHVSEDQTITARRARDEHLWEIRIWSSASWLAGIGVFDKDEGEESMLAGRDGHGRAGRHWILKYQQPELW